MPINSQNNFEKISQINLNTCRVFIGLFIYCQSENLKCRYSLMRNVGQCKLRNRTPQPCGVGRIHAIQHVSHLE